jgi:rhamnosyltransferase
MSTYNGEKYIEAQLNSIINQHMEADIHIRIRDDGSNDDTCAVIGEMIKKYPQAIELQRGINKGYNASFFELINNADGYDYYAISDQDDVWIEDKLQTAIERLENEADGNPLLYASVSYLVEDDLKPYGTTRKQKRKFTTYNTIIQNICPGHTQVMNNELLKLVKGSIDVSRIYVYDSWITNIAMLYGRIIFDNHPHTLYRQHKGNQLGSGKGIIGQLVSSAKRAETGDGHCYRRQIEYFVEMNKDKLVEKRYYNELQRFLSANKLFTKLQYAFTGKLYRQRKEETLAFYLAVIFGRY